MSTANGRRLGRNDEIEVGSGAPGSGGRSQPIAVEHGAAAAGGPYPLAAGAA